MRTQFCCIFVKLYNKFVGLSDKITHMVVKFVVTQEYEDEKGTFTQAGYVSVCCKIS